MNRHLLAVVALVPPLMLACPGDDDDDFTGAFGDPQIANVTLAVHDTIGSIVVASWEQLESTVAWIEYGVDEDQWRSSPSRTMAPGPQSQLLLGIPYGEQVTVRVINDFGDGPLRGDELTIDTDPVPEGVPLPTVEVAERDAWDPSIHFVLASMDEPSDTLVPDYWTFIFDRQGRVVWAYETPHFRATLQAQPSHDGSEILIDHNTFWAIFDGGASSQVLRLRIDGTEVALHDTPGLHHPFTEIAGGSLVWGAIDHPDEQLWELHADGTLESFWSCGAFHAALDGIPGSANCASNTVWWNEADDTFLVSFYSTNSVVEVDHATGEVVRYFGHLPDAWTFDPPESEFWWQHGTHYTDDGTLLVSARITQQGHETVAREYQLDDDTRTLTQVWSFGEGEGIFGSEMGEAARLPGGNTLHNYGSGARLREVTPDGELVWDVVWGDGTFLGRTTPLPKLYPFAP